MIEVWKDIKGYEGKYQVSSFGNVKSFRGENPKILKPNVLNKGHLIIRLSNNSKVESILIHRLVGESFGILKTRDFIEGIEINHIDGNKTNNRIDNLEASNRSKNTIHAYKNGLIKNRKGEGNPNLKYKEETIKKILVMTRAGFKRRQISICLGIPKSLVSAVKAKINWKHVTI